MEIRKLEDKDIAEVVTLWYNTSVVAHNFISTNYWEENMDAMANEYLPNSETYLALKNQEIIGFISMVENYLSALFIHNELKRNGIGKQLLNYVKKKKEIIHLGVFRKNLDATRFYLSQNFNILSEKKDIETGEFVIKMEWNKQ